ncbi:restriction endonuclease subunit S [Enterocloster clostridioformis]
MEKYNEFRDTGLPWVEKIPKGWKLVKIKYVLKERIEKNNPMKTENILSLTAKQGVVPYDQKEGGGNKPKEDVTNYKLAYPGDIVINSMNILSGSTGLSHYFGCVSPVYYMLYPYDGDVRYYSYIFLDEAFQKSLYGLGNGIQIKESSNGKLNTIRMRIPMDKLSSLRIPVPMVLEQKAIADYLDDKCKSIDTLVIGLEKQLEEIQHFKRELIANIITKGMNKTVSMKDSDVDWMGNIPKHWNVTKLKWMFEIVKRIYGAEDRDVLSITQRGIKIKDIDINDGQMAESYANYQVVNVNDFAMNSMDLLTGWVDCSPYEGVTSPDYRVFRFHPDKPQCHTYYKYLFQMCYTNRVFYRLGQGVSNLGRWRLQADQFLNIRLPQPPIEEQEQIAAYLDTRVGQIEELTADIKAQIEKQKEYRKIVIHDAVTGKIKVTEGE